MDFLRPFHRNDFKVGIFCALPLEYDAVTYIFDELWEESAYGRAQGDDNNYTTGRVGKHSVVLSLLPNTGKVSAAGSAASMRSSYSGLRLVLIVGICGGMPRSKTNEILLGDVIIGKNVVQYDFGRQYSNDFIRKDTLDDNLGRPNKTIRSLLISLETHRGCIRIEQQTTEFLKVLQELAAQTGFQGKYDYIGAESDKLFIPTYRHKHQTSLICACTECSSDNDSVCDKALESSCEEVGCDDTYLVIRERLQKEQLQRGQPPIKVHVGTVASGDSVIKSAAHRNKLATDCGVIAFEMESAGVWDELPCFVVKGVCDYADSHKQKEWQNFAAATAAAASKAILEKYIPLDEGMDSTQGQQLRRSISTVPFPPDPNFINRHEILNWISEKSSQPASRIALVGLGGIGKSQLAIQYTHQVRQQSPDTSIFWVHAATQERIKEACQFIAERLKLPQRHSPQGNIFRLVSEWLSDEENGPWMVILDSADDIKMFKEPEQNLASFLPQGSHGSILITSRSKDVARLLVGDEGNIFSVPPMKPEEACQLLEKKLQKSDYEESSELVHTLDYMPLAITQAAAFINRRAPRMSVAMYLEEFRKSDKKRATLLNKDTGDLRRDYSVSNSIVTTWQITFDQIREESSTAAELLCFMSLLNSQGIPDFILLAYEAFCSVDREHLNEPLEDGLKEDLKEDLENKLDVLRGYSLVAVTEDIEIFEMHPLVQFCTSLWLSSNEETKRWKYIYLRAMAMSYPLYVGEHWQIKLKCQMLEPHIQPVLEGGSDDNREERWIRTAIMYKIALYWQRTTERYEEMEKLFRQYLEVRCEALGIRHPDVVLPLVNVAMMLEQLGRHDEAALMLIRAIQAKEQEQEHDEAYFWLLKNLAENFLKQEKFSDAEQICRQSVVGHEELFGKVSIITILNVRQLIHILKQQHKYDEAEKLCRELLDTPIELDDRSEPDKLDLFGNSIIMEHNSVKEEEMKNVCELISVLQDQEKSEEAGDLIRKTLEAHGGMFADGNIFRPIVVERFCSVLESQGMAEESLLLYRGLLTTMEKFWGVDHPELFDTVLTIIDILQRQEKYTEAGQTLSQAIGIVSSPANKDWEPIQALMDKFGEILYKQQEAEADEDKSISDIISYLLG